MSFWTYMLHCSGGQIYVGHTDNLEHRVAQHEAGALAGFTRDHLPVKLVWSEEFGSRQEAKEAEKRLKGWGQAKKLALIRGDWALISSLAKGKEGASTSSAQAVESDHPTQTVRPELVEGPSSSLRATRVSHGGKGRASTSSARAEEGKLSTRTVVWNGLLHPHFETLPDQAFSLEVAISRRVNGLKLRYRLHGEIDLLVLPGPVAPRRADNLWQTTCFELFVQQVDEPGYQEFNFSPSGAWAAYRFDQYRAGMIELPADPGPRLQFGKAEIVLIARIPAPPGLLRLGLSAVIEEANGAKSYWALAHPDPEKPDFHDPRGFTLELPAA